MMHYTQLFRRNLSTIANFNFNDFNITIIFQMNPTLPTYIDHSRVDKTYIYSIQHYVIIANTLKVYIYILMHSQKNIDI